MGAVVSDGGGSGADDCVIKTQIFAIVLFIRKKSAQRFIESMFIRALQSVTPRCSRKEAFETHANLFKFLIILQLSLPAFISPHKRIPLHVHF